jgi:hypothetical protein
VSGLGYAVGGPLSNVKALAPLRREVQGLILTVEDGTLTVEFASPEQEDEATRYGHALAARLGAILRADVTWTVSERREPRFKTFAPTVYVSTRFALVAQVGDLSLDLALAHRECLEQHPELAEVDDDLARYRTTRAANHLRDAVDRLARIASKHLPDSPLVADGALQDLVNAMAAHHHGPRAVGRSKNLRDESLREISACYERAAALLEALVKRFCG